MKRESLAIGIVVLILIGLPVGVLIYKRQQSSSGSAERVINIQAAVPESGGFQPAAIKVKAGETVTLRFSSVDVTHGIAIGPGLGIDLGHVDPGHVQEVTLTFDKAGTYTFYCNTWCSPDHWRMRGIVDVVDPTNPDAVPAAYHDPIIEALVAEGVNIDANTSMDMPDHPQPDVLAFDRPPSIEKGQILAATMSMPDELRDAEWRLSHTPTEGLVLLEGVNPSTSMSDLINVIAYMWTSESPPEDIQWAEEYYNKNCAACHGQTGEAKGPAANQTAQSPVAFADFTYLFEVRSDVLYAKIRRGGMGTDMPNFGTLLTPEETLKLVEYLWQLAWQSGDG
ncbi:Cytochrome c oxidase subunit 2 [Anaerolineae bacterium]|nr:Cytochrome c oxidase subunit 2 [Anaerolineae bacterium]